MFGAIRLAVYRGGAAVPHLVLRRIGGRAVRVGCLYGSRAVPGRASLRERAELPRRVRNSVAVHHGVACAGGVLLAADRGRAGKDPDVCTIM